MNLRKKMSGMSMICTPKPRQKIVLNGVKMMMMKKTKIMKNRMKKFK